MEGWPASNPNECSPNPPDSSVQDWGCFFMHGNIRQVMYLMPFLSFLANYP